MYSASRTQRSAAQCAFYNNSTIMKFSFSAVWSLLLLICLSSSTATSSNDKNAKYQEGSTSSGIISTVAGYKVNGEGSAADGVAATSKQLLSPDGLALGTENNLFIAGTNDNKIWKVTASSGLITTIAGTGVAGFSGDTGQATSSKLSGPRSVCLDTTGNIYIADTINTRIRKVTVNTGVITTVAGGGYSLGDGLAIGFYLSKPVSVAVDTAGNIFFSDSGRNKIYKVTVSTGMLTTVVGSTSPAYGVAIATKFYLSDVAGITLDTSGNIFLAGGTGNACVFKVTASTGLVSVVAGAGVGFVCASGYNNDDILATKARLNVPVSVAVDASGNIFIADSANYRIRKVSASTGIITTVAGTGVAGSSPSQGDGGSATSASFNTASGITVDSVGNIYFSDSFQNVVKKVTVSGTTPSASVTPAPAVTPAPPSPVASTPTVSTPSAPAATPTVTPAPAVTPAPFSPVASTPTISTPSAPAATPSTSASTAPAPTTPTTQTAPTPSASSTSSKAPSAPSSPASQRSATTHIAQAFHPSLALLSSLLILSLYRDT